MNLSPAKFTQAEYDRRHRAVLFHAALYRLLLPSCVTSSFGHGKSIPQVYSRLMKAGLLVPRPGVLPAGGSCYSLSAAGCRAVNTPAVRATFPEGPSLDLSVAVSVFCHLGKCRRYRVEAERASEIVGTPLPTNLAYVLTNEVGGTETLLRCVSAATLGTSECVRTVRLLSDQTRRNSVLGSWLESKHFGFAVLCPTAHSLAATEKAIEKSGIRSSVVVVTGLGPTAETLNAALKHKWK